MNSKETLRQALSALMDNQADDLQVQRVLQSVNDPEVRETWARYHVARDANQDDAHNLFAGIDLSAGVMAAIEQQDAAAITEPIAQDKSTVSSKFTGLTRVAIAASVTLAVLAGVRFYNQTELETTELTASAVEPMEMLAPVSATQQTSDLASFNEGKHSPAAEAVEGDSNWHADRLPEYLSRHAQQAPAAISVEQVSTSTSNE